MKVIDSHLHFWELENHINSWVMKQSNKDLQTNYLPDNIINNFNGGELVGVVHVEAHDSAVPTVKEIKWLQDKMKNKKLQYKHVAFADITLPSFNFAAMIDQIKHHSNVIGIRHILSYNPKFSYNPNDVDLSLNENIKDNLTYLAKNNLVFDCQVYSHQLKNILPAILQANVITVIDHMLLPAWNNFNDADHKLWQNAVTEISKHSNIYIKLSGIDIFQNINYFDVAVKYCLEKLSINRLVFGSNYPVSFNYDYNVWFNYLINLRLTETENKHIFYKNAVDLFKFN